MKLHHLLLPIAMAVSALSAQAQDKLKIGFMSSFTGPLAGIAKDKEDGFRLGLKAAGGKLGGLETEVVVGDDQQNPDVGKQVFDKMVKRDRVQLVTGVLFTNVMNAIAPVAFKEKVFFINSNNGPSGLAGDQCNAFYFNTGFQSDTPAEAMGKYATDKGLKKVFVIAPNFPASQEHLKGFKRQYQTQTAGETFVKLGQLDFSVEIGQIRQTKPDAVYVYLFGAMASNFIKQYAQAGLIKDAPLIGPGFGFDDDTIRGVGDSIVGSLNAWPWSPDLDNPTNRKFVESFKAEYKRAPSTYAALGYDTAMLIDASVRKAGGKLADKGVLQKAFQDSGFKSVRGDFRFGDNGSPIQTFYLRQVGKGADGEISNRIVSTLLANHKDAYADQCTTR